MSQPQEAVAAGLPSSQPQEVVAAGLPSSSTAPAGPVAPVKRGRGRPRKDPNAPASPPKPRPAAALIPWRERLVVSKGEACAILGLGKTTIDGLGKRGELDITIVGGKALVTVASMHRLVDRAPRRSDGARAPRSMPRATRTPQSSTAS